MEREINYNSIIIRNFTQKILNAISELKRTDFLTPSRSNTIMVARGGL
jgi:hypothetical protein